MFTISAVKRSVWVLAFLVALVACSGGGSPTGGAAEEGSVAPATGTYSLDGNGLEFLVLEDDARFCLLAEGMTLGGTYEVDGTALTLTADGDHLGPQTGTIEGDVITDPDGEEWIRSADVDTGSCRNTTDDAMLPSLLDALAEGISTAPWPSHVDDAAAALDRLPRVINGYRADPPHPVDVGPATVTVTFPDPAYDGPVSGVSVLVLRVPPSITAAKLVDATAHMGFVLGDERTHLDADEPVPLVLGRILEVEGAGKLPDGHDGYLAVWSRRGGHVAFAVIADDLRSLSEGFAAVLASTS